MGCLNCTSATNCSLCDSLTILETTNNSCTPNCSLVTNCTTCYINSSTVICQTCILGYVVNISNMCATFCGDGIIMGYEVCDDNNNINGDGCSSNCSIEPAFYCSGSPSMCRPCLQYCYACTTATDYSQCNAITIWDSASNICFANCSVINYCLTCTVSSSGGKDSIQCLNCSRGYSVASSSILYLSTCGDGIKVIE